MAWRFDVTAEPVGGGERWIVVLRNEANLDLVGVVIPRIVLGFFRALSQARPSPTTMTWSVPLQAGRKMASSLFRWLGHNVWFLRAPPDLVDDVDGDD